jgi:thioredoxin-dependent peroxiredoxin
MIAVSSRVKPETIYFLKVRWNMKERKNLVAMKGNPLTLLGKDVKVGDKAPDFKVLANDLSVVDFSSFRGKICVIASVPSLDTSVCDIMTRRFNEEAVKLGSDVAILTISMDLPFAQKRWCGAAGVKNVQTLSDYRDASFGTAFGVLIKELRLLARAVFVVDREGVIRYIQLVNELTSEPDYQAVLNAVKTFMQPVGSL